VNLQSFPVESTKLFLADLSPEFAELEGEVPVDDRVWIVARQATQADNMSRADMYTKREVKYGTDTSGSFDSVSRVYNENALRRHMFEVFLTLKDIGNLKDGDKNVFPKMPAKDIKRSEFEAIWGNLHPTVATAIHLACMQQNPDWVLDRQGE